MTQEEKAKRYDEILAMANEQHQYPWVRKVRDVLEELFPELKEDEDERIRKWLISQLKIKSDGTDSDLNIMIGKAIAWLEKQGNKFVNIDIESMVSSYKQRLESQGSGGIKNSPLLNMCVFAFKRGIENVLDELNLEKLEKPQGKSALEAIKEEKVNNADEVVPKFKVGDIVQYITDSTDRRKIEEVDELCNMYHTDSEPIMFEVEDEWKIIVLAEDVEQESENYKRQVMSEMTDLVKDYIKQKPVWSEEDERMFHAIIADLKGFKHGNTSTLASYFDNCIAWLESLKGRVQPQSNWKPSEEQMKALNDAIIYVKYSMFPSKNVLKKLYGQLKKLREE